MSNNITILLSFPECVGWVQSTINRGVRSSSATSYLAPNFISRPNLNVVLHARVTKVLSSGNSSNASGRPDIRSINIQFTQNNGGKRQYMHSNECD